MTRQELIDAIFVSRKERASHPEGRTDNGGRWYPSEDEQCDCCRYIRSPSRAYPWSYMVHCRTKKHVKELVDRHFDTNYDWLAQQV